MPWVEKLPVDGELKDPVDGELNDRVLLELLLDVLGRLVLVLGAGDVRVGAGVERLGVLVERLGVLKERLDEEDEAGRLLKLLLRLPLENERLAAMTGSAVSNVQTTATSKASHRRQADCFMVRGTSFIPPAGRLLPPPGLEPFHTCQS